MSRTTSPQAGLPAGAVLVVPVGATEQHGPHLPLTTDTDIAVELGRRLSAKLAYVCLAPAVAYGASGEHAAFPGTLSVGADATRELLVELCRSATATWSRVLLLSTHGGNATAVRSATRQLCAEGRDVRAWSPDWGGDAHAGHVETSAMLCIAPARVRMDVAVAGARAPITELIGLLRTEGVAAASVNGVLGDPTTASVQAGLALLQAATDTLVSFVGDWPPRRP